MPRTIITTQVAIMGAGPAGLMLSHLLAKAGIESTVIEVRSHKEISEAVRAGILEHGTVNMLVDSGVSDRVLLSETFHQGFAQLKGVVDPDTWGIAVPVLDARQRAVASLGVVVPLREMRLQALVPALQTAARGIARRLNGT